VFYLTGRVVKIKKFRINQFIKVPEVRLVDSDGSKVGIVKTSDALYRAQSQELDLVEVSSEATPPVCKILNFSKFKYEESKKEREAKKKQKSFRTKEIRVRPRIGEHDLVVKIKHIVSFISSGDKVQVTVIFSGREMQHKELGFKIIDEIRKKVIDIAETDGKICSMGNRIFLTLSPKKD
jgi:translation initiation factor IF-3